MDGKYGTSDLKKLQQLLQHCTHLDELVLNTINIPVEHLLPEHQ